MSLPAFPQIPTDNLYKFKAISGVLVVLAALMFGGWVTWEREAALDRSDIRMKTFRELFHADTAQITALARLSTSGAAKDEIAASRRRADSLDRAFEDARLATEIELDALGKLNNRVVIAEIVCVVIALAGLTFSVDAFKQWQVRHQDFQDRLAVAQAERTELEVQALRKQIAREDESVSIQPTP